MNNMYRDSWTRNKHTYTFNPLGILGNICLSVLSYIRVLFIVHELTVSLYIVKRASPLPRQFHKHAPEREIIPAFRSTDLLFFHGFSKHHATLFVERVKVSISDSSRKFSDCHCSNVGIVQIWKDLWIWMTWNVFQSFWTGAFWI